MPSPVDNSINMNNPTTPVQPDNEEAVVAETPQRRTRARTRLDEEFTEQSNGRWRCNTCNPVVIILKDSRSGHITRPYTKTGQTTTLSFSLIWKMKNKKFNFIYRNNIN
jgi:hypothetical protein